MVRNQAMAYWRVGLVFVLYGMLYVSQRFNIPLWGMAFVIPLYVFLRPPDKETLAGWEKVQSDGILFYVVKWTLVLVLITVGVLLLAAVLFSWSLQDILAQANKNGFIVIALFFSTIVSWFVNGRYYREMLRRKAAEREAQEKKQRKRKKRT